MPSDESKGSQLDAMGSLAQRQLDNTIARVVPPLRGLRPCARTEETYTGAGRSRIWP